MASMDMDMLSRLTDYSVDDAENIMDVRTEKIDPIVSSAYRYTFRLDTSAYLDKNTMLLFKCKAKDGTVSAANCRLNCFNGGLGAIKDVTIRVGDFVLQKLHQVNEWATLNHLYSLTPEVQNKKLSSYLQNGLAYEVLNAQGTPASDNVGVIAVDGNKSGINYGRSDTRVGAAVNNHLISNDKSANQLVGIPLGMLIPMLNTRDLPLFLFSAYKILIEIEFEPDSSLFVNKLGAGAPGAPSANLAAAEGDILFDDVNLLVDYLVFPSRVQESVREKTQQEGGYMMDFINVENIQKVLPAATANTEQKQEFRINVINQEVHYIQMTKQFQTYADNNNKVVLGQRADSSSIESYQCNINGVDSFNFGFLHNPVEHYNQMSYVLGRDIQVISPYYVADVNIEASMISPPPQGILGKYKPLGIDLRNGEPTIRGGGRMIGDYPVRWIYRRTPHAQVNSDIAGTPQIGQDDTSGANVNFFVGTTRIVNVKSLPSGGMIVNVSDL